MGQFAAQQHIVATSLLVVGGADDGSHLVVGPREDRTLPLAPMHYALEHAHEVAGVGTLFCDATGTPLVHMHMACGRAGATVTGCIRSGVKVWRVMEVIHCSGTHRHHRPPQPGATFGLEVIAAAVVRWSA